MEEVYDSGNIPKQVCALHKLKKAAETSADGNSRILFPRRGDIFKINPAVALGSQSIRLQASLDKNSVYYWEMDGEKLATEGDDTWWNLVPGKHQVSLWVEKTGGPVLVQTVKFLVVP